MEKSSLHKSEIESFDQVRCLVKPCNNFIATLIIASVPGF
jgi:hypothetical protein